MSFCILALKKTQ